MISGSLKQLPRPLLFKGCFAAFSLGRVHPSFAKEGNTPFLDYHPENDTRQTIETRALTSRQRSSACVKCNLDSSAFAKEGTSLALSLVRNLDSSARCGW